MADKMIMILADGFEETEAVTVADVLRRLDFDLLLCGLKGREVKGAHNIKFTADCSLQDVDARAFKAFILPGGLPGAMNLRESDALMDFAGKIYAGGGIAAAICAAPIALARFGITAGKTITAYPGFEQYLEGNRPTGAMTEVDDRVITGKGPGAGFEFAARIAEKFGKAEEVKQLYEVMFVK
ncbi:DJ-1/PfpI family protein [Lentisphaerota bacterium ZTH]|nr:DJ-1/PfpI family protein [Lentisphaerota bacterium]WET07082.1 DJ-1/PfpI family protein [Lentisphaerota bacterium ZTH]